MWEILVPTVKSERPLKYYTTRYHRVWDEKVRELTGGLTIMTPGKGQWVSPSGKVFIERMIPVRIMATREEIEKIVDLTLNYYSQEAVLCYKISNEVILRYSDEAR